MDTSYGAARGAITFGRADGRIVMLIVMVAVVVLMVWC